MAEYQDKWGRKTARERYGSHPNPNMKPEDTSAPQKLGDKNNLRGPDWQDDHANDWVRGAGMRPGFKNSQG